MSLYLTIYRSGIRNGEQVRQGAPSVATATISTGTGLNYTPVMASELWYIEGDDINTHTITWTLPSGATITERWNASRKEYVNMTFGNALSELA